MIGQQTVLQIQREDCLDGSQVHINLTVVIVFELVTTNIDELVDPLLLLGVALPHQVVQ